MCGCARGCVYRWRLGVGEVVVVQVVQRGGAAVEVGGLCQGVQPRLPGAMRLRVQAGMQGLVLQLLDLQLRLLTGGGKGRYPPHYSV